MKTHINCGPVLIVFYHVTFLPQQKCLQIPAWHYARRASVNRGSLELFTCCSKRCVSGHLKYHRVISWRWARSFTRYSSTGGWRVWPCCITWLPIGWSGESRTISDASDPIRLGPSRSRTFPGPTTHIRNHTAQSIPWSLGSTTRLPVLREVSQRGGRGVAGGLAMSQ